MDIEKDLFDIFQTEKDNYELYKKVIGYVKSVIHESLGFENAKFYEKFVKLSNSINNAGHEDRRSADIEYINNTMWDISDEYEEFLP